MKDNFQKQLNEPNVVIKNGWKNTDFYAFVHAMWLMQTSSHDYTATVKELTALEKKNIPTASTLLGLCYADKEWKKANDKKMLGYYEKAADGDDPYACYLLAKLHFDGNGAVKADKNNGFGWKRLPKSFMAENTVFLLLTALYETFTDTSYLTQT